MLELFCVENKIVLKAQNYCVENTRTVYIFVQKLIGKMLVTSALAFTPHENV